MSKGAPLHFLPLLPMPRLALERAFEAALDEIYALTTNMMNECGTLRVEHCWTDLGEKLAQLRAYAQGEII